MNISKALKVKNRLAGEVSRLQELIHRENSKREDNPHEVDFAKALSDLETARAQLVEIKSKICKASAEISYTLAALAEEKSNKVYLERIPVRELSEFVSMGAGNAPREIKYSNVYTRADIDGLVTVSQNTINTLQDTIDEFNARTQI